MPRHRREWDDDYGGPPRRPRGYEEPRGGGRGSGDYERGRDFDERGGPPPRYEYDERTVARGGRPWGLRGDYDTYAYGRGDYYRDEYYAGRPPDFADEPDYGRRPRRRPARSHLRCRDIMTRDVTVATRETTLREVAAMMRDEDTGVIPVVEPGETPSDSVTEVQRVPARIQTSGRLVGLITDRDIVVRALAEGRDAREVRAGEIMTTELHTVGPNDRVIEAIRLMGDRQVRRVPVVGRDGHLRGIISMADVALETEADRELAEALEEISSGPSFWSRIFG
ncbi:MAG TPA: CBS domain-containing protein [Pyrinomonadaceae bacterium]|nr:CBS domain-containing protein [Pyrinomonadaceae bacterium]